MALPIAGKFLTKIYADGSLGVERTDRFDRSEEEPDYSCDVDIVEEEPQSEFVDDDNFFGDDDFF